jgi:hypothetical protein
MQPKHQSRRFKSRDARQFQICADSYTWDAAKTYCSGLGSGWRLPGLKELLTLVDPTRASTSSIDPVAFPNTPALFFLTASPFAGSSGSAWHVSFLSGSSGPNFVGNTDRVRCVR